MGPHDELFARWCERLWQTQPRARARGLDTTLPRDHMPEVAERIAEELADLRALRRDLERDVAGGKPGAERRLVLLEQTIADMESYASRVENGRLAAIVVDSCVGRDPHVRLAPDPLPQGWQPPTLPGPLAREESRQTGEQRRRGFAAFTAERLADNTVLAGVLERFGVEGVYAFAELTQGQVEVVWLEHRGVPPREIAEMTGRQLGTVLELLDQAAWKLQRLGGDGWSVDVAEAG